MNYPVEYSHYLYQHYGRRFKCWSYLADWGGKFFLKRIPLKKKGVVPHLEVGGLLLKEPLKTAFSLCIFIWNIMTTVMLSSLCPDPGSPSLTGHLRSGPLRSLSPPQSLQICSRAKKNLNFQRKGHLRPCPAHLPGHPDPASIMFRSLPFRPNWNAYLDVCIKTKLKNTLHFNKLILNTGTNNQSRCIDVFKNSI